MVAEAQGTPMKATESSLSVRAIPVRELLARADFLLGMLVGILALASAYYWLLLQVSTLEVTYGNMAREPIYLALIIVLVPASMFLFGFNFALTALLFQINGSLRWMGGSLLGGITGGFGAGCPVCGALLLSLLGVAGGLTVLPFAGLEIWLASVAIMGVAASASLRGLSQKACDRDTQTGACWRLPPVQARQLTLLALLAAALVANLYWMLRINEPAFRVQISLFQLWV